MQIIGNHFGTAFHYLNFGLASAILYLMESLLSTGRGSLNFAQAYYFLYHLDGTYEDLLS